MKLNNSINKPLVFIIMLLISITLSFTILGYIYYLFPKLSDFRILKVYEEQNKLLLETTKCYNAIRYHLVALDENNNIVYENDSKTNIIDISEINLLYKQNINFEVVTYNRKNESKKSDKVYSYINQVAAFGDDKNYSTDKEDIKMKIDGFNIQENYHLELYYKDSVILKKDITEENIIINYNELNQYDGKITAKLYNKNNRIISLKNYYLNAPIVGNIKITNPTNGYTTLWDDVTIYYTGGANATNLNVKIYNSKNKLVNTISMPYEKDKIVLSADLFKENESYKILLNASYKDYVEIAKSDEVTINVLEKKTVSPVYVDKNFTFIKKDSQVNLLTNTENANIYYTMDGTKPTVNSIKYEGPITISNDVTIKTFAVKDNMYDSEINTYEFKVKDKKLVVYLSPSNQYGNKGVSEVGFTNERDMMNKLTDYLEADLKNAGVVVYRNKSSGNINQWLAESNAKKSDFHFAIHSNGSTNHDTKGMEIYVDKSTSKCLSIASNIYNGLYEIYPYRDEISDRGVKYASGSLGEVNDDFIKCGSLIEIAYHDNYYDAMWIVNNMDAIAQNIANSILKYYQVIE